MTHHAIPRPKDATKRALFVPLALILVLVIACGSAAQPTSAPDTSAQQPEPTVPQINIAPVVPATLPAAAASGGQPAPTTAPEPADMPEAVMQPKYGGFINMSQYADVRQRLIHQSNVLNMNLSPLFNTLMEFNPETDDPSDLRCDLCTDWSLAPDGVTYTFNLHPDATWWDGVPVTADDVVFSFESMVNPDQFEILKGRSTSSGVNTEIYYESGNARAIDDKTVEIVTKFPSGSFLTAISIETTMIQPRHTVVDQGIPQGGKDLAALNGSGAFKFVAYEKEISVEYTKNTEYWKDGMPRIDGMKHFVIPDPGRVIAAFKTGQVLTSNQALTNLSAKEAVRLDEEMDNLTMHWGGPVSAMYVLMNTSKKPFDDVRVRRAVHLALHRQPFIETLSGGIDLMGYPLPEGFWYSNTAEEYANMPGYRELNGEKHRDDLAEAKSLVTDAGVGEGTKLTLSARNCCGYPDVAVIAKEQLQEALGWEITIENLESGAGFDKYWAGDFDFMAQGGSIWSTDPDALYSRFVRGTVMQWSGGGRGKRFIAPGLDDLYDEQLQSSERGVRVPVVQQMQDILVNEDWANPYLYWQMRHQPVEHRIQNYHFTNDSRSWEHVWCDPAC